MDETYIKIIGQWCYLYRAVDKLCNTVDFLLTVKKVKNVYSFIFNQSEQLPLQT
jgi:putative transposase